MRQPAGDPVKIGVTSGGSLLGQGILRALKQSSLRVHITALDVSPLSAGLYWSDEAFLIPKASAPEYIDTIRRMMRQVNPDVLLVGTEVELAPLAAARRDLERDFGTRILVSSPDVVAIADDKYSTASFLSRHGFQTPASALADDMSAVEMLVRSHGFPLIVKPCVGTRSYGVVRVRNRPELNHAVRSIPNAVVQECVGDDTQEYTASGLYFDGACDAVVVMRRDLRDGNTYRAYTVLDSELYSQVRAWTMALRPHGPANFQFRIDRDGRAKVFEINARFSGTTALRAQVGFNEVAMCVRKLLWNEPILQPSIRPLTILRHWSETLVDPQRIEAVRMV